MAEKILLGQFTVVITNRYKDLLAAQGAETEVIHNLSTCKSGSCGTTMELWGFEKDIPIIREVFQKEQQRNYEGLNINPELLSQVYDSEKETAVCPACGTEFSTSSSTCTDCGLQVG